MPVLIPGSNEKIVGDFSYKILDFAIKGRGGTIPSRTIHCLENQAMTIFAAMSWQLLLVEVQVYIY